MSADPVNELAQKARARLRIEAKPPSDCVISQSVDPIPIVDLSRALVSIKLSSFFFVFFLLLIKRARTGHSRRSH